MDTVVFLQSSLRLKRLGWALGWITVVDDEMIFDRQFKDRGLTMILGQAWPKTDPSFSQKLYNQWTCFLDILTQYENF